MKRITLISAVGESLTQIAIANNFFTDLGSNIFYWLSPDAEYDTNSLIYRDVGEEHTQIGNTRENQLHLEVEAVLFTDTPGTDGNKACADIIKALGVDPTWNGLCFNTQLVKSETAVDTVGKTAVRIIVYVDLFYRVSLWAF